MEALGPNEEQRGGSAERLGRLEKWSGSGLETGSQSSLGGNGKSCESSKARA